MIKRSTGLASLFILLFSSASTTEWTLGVPLPHSQAIIKTVSQILDDADQKKNKHEPPGPTPVLSGQNEISFWMSASRINNLIFSPPKHRGKEEYKKEAPFSNIDVSAKKNFYSKILTSKNHTTYNSAKPPFNFRTATFEDSGVVPPDAMGVVGPEQFILAANGRIRSFNKHSGELDHILDISSDVFFSPISEGFTSDSRIRYDRFSDRWYIVITAASMKPIRVLIAMSDSGIISDKTQWSFFYFEPRPADWSDYPTLGIDKNALYIGLNFLKDKKYVTSDGIVIPKAPLLTGTLKAFAFLNLVDPDPTKFEGPISPQGVDNFDLDATEGYLIGIDGRPGRLMLRRIKDPGGLPSISENISIVVPRSDFPLEAPQKDSNTTDSFFLQGFDKRLGNTHIRNNHLFTAHNVAVDNMGNVESPTPSRDGCMWYEIDLKNPDKPSIVQSGILYQRTPENDREERFFWMPGVMTNGLQTLAIACCTSGDQAYANAAYAIRYSNDPTGTLRQPQIYTKSHVVYKLGFPPFKNLRWGEYTTASVDPIDNMTLWCISEFTFNEVSWGLQAIRIPAQPPAHVTSLNPSKIKIGQKNVPVTISGERVEGSGFYDPDKTFPSHLKVEIEDISIISTKWISPTQIDVVISTEGSTLGFKKVTITNPDGQTVDAEGALEVISQ
jgi:hypothetical protein